MPDKLNNSKLTDVLRKSRKRKRRQELAKIILRLANIADVQAYCCKGSNTKNDELKLTISVFRTGKKSKFQLVIWCVFLVIALYMHKHEWQFCFAAFHTA